MTVQSPRPDVLLSERAVAEARTLRAQLDSGARLAALGSGPPEGLPAEVARVLTEALDLMALGKTVVVGSRPDELTTTAAAAELGVSRPTLMKLIRSGRIAAHKVGTHTRLRAEDVDRYRLARRVEQKAAFDALRELEAEAG